MRARETERGRGGSIFKGRNGWGKINQKGDRQRETENKVTHRLVHCDKLCIRTKKDCSATHLFRLFPLNINLNGILYMGLDNSVILALTNIVLMMQ